MHRAIKIVSMAACNEHGVSHASKIVEIKNIMHLYHIKSIISIIQSTYGNKMIVF